MKIKNIDHLVITTQNLDACLHFYADILGMECDVSNGRYLVRFGNQKFNIHTKKAEFLPAAAFPTYGSLDLCLVVDGDIETVKQEIAEKGYPIEEGPVIRHGALGEMKSIYLRDPDGNLIELSSYSVSGRSQVSSHPLDFLK
ncbi:MAG: VOC family protein [Lachnospiraceae bacterium]|nr:VOC family protein [Lachnospiraceae bacterium]MCH4063980.1 VOC family protein [Lachnospiraceae bacterium]MCH4103297.1 VOC family protein [Lachnospiraceae bacterium]